jgi:hypothetical protein
VIVHILQIGAAIAFIMMCTLLPFLPGRYDAVAMTVSLMAQVFGRIGLLLVPVGLFWLAFERPSRHPRTRFVAATVALVMTTLVWSLVSLVAMISSPLFGLLCLGIGAYAVRSVLPSLRALDSTGSRAASMLPLYLIVVPPAVALLQLAVADEAMEFSRNRAIRNSASLIADIEAHKVANGRYPLSMISVHPDYKPSIVGIREYRYEPFGDAYNVLFENPTIRLGTQEIVVYNPRDEQAIASHALDVIQLSPAALALDRTRGHNAVYHAAHPHWKYFWFD